MWTNWLERTLGRRNTSPPADAHGRDCRLAVGDDAASAVAGAAAGVEPGLRCAAAADVAIGEPPLE